MPVATHNLKAWVEGTLNGVAGARLYLKFNAAGAVSDLQSADPGYVQTTNQNTPKLTFPATFPSGKAPDEELPSGTTITVEAQATNVAGTVTKISNIITPARVFNVGDQVGGGEYVGKILDGGVWYNLVLASYEHTTWSNRHMFSINGNTNGTPNPGMRFSTTNGPGIMENYLASSQPHNFPVFSYVKSLTINGYSDWYIPASDEAELIFRQYKRNNNNNNAGAPQYTQANANSDPPGFMYTPTNPAMNSNPIFQYPKGAEYLGRAPVGAPNPDFIDWISATLADTTNYIVQDMDFSSQKKQPVDTHSNAGFYRPVRRFPA
jgi:hypothetical protein